MQDRYIELRNNNIFSRYKLVKRCGLALDMIKKHFPSKIKRVLDIGACDGKMLGCMANDKSGIFSGAELVGLEPNPYFISKCGDERVHIRQASGEKIDFPEKYFDLAVNSLALEHIKDAQKSLSEVYRVLEDGGLFVLITVMPFYHTLITKSGFKKDEHFRNFTLKEAVEALEKHGFTVIEKKSILFPIFYNIIIAGKNRTAKNA